MRSNAGTGFGHLDRELRQRLHRFGLRLAAGLLDIYRNLRRRLTDDLNANGAADIDLATHHWESLCVQ